MKSVDRYKNTTGLTLLELLAVLVLILLVAGLAWPVTQRTVVRARFDAAVRELQAELYRTRLEAVRGATPYAFRYKPGTGIYEILPKEVLDRENAGRQVGATALSSDSIEDAFGSLQSHADPHQNTGADFGSSLSESATPTVGDAALSQEATDLATHETGIGTYYRKSLPSVARFGAGGDDSENEWSAAILFYPNGRTSNARLTLYSSGNDSYRKTLQFRGLSGTIAPVSPATP